MDKCCITFDVDMQVSKQGKTIFIDEFEYCFDSIANILKRFPQVKTTWFLRMDNQIEETYGRADYLFAAHPEKIQWLKEHGHQIGWHIHSCRYSHTSGWIQNTAAEEVILEVQRHLPLAKKHEILNTVRFGGGYQCNSLMQFLDKSGCAIDSSSIPRPNYAWSNPFAVWDLTGQSPYYPSASQYQLPGPDALKILEIPMSTTWVPSSYDNGKEILRYVNPAYHRNTFLHAFENLKGDCVLITHPYESFSYWDCSHELLSYNVGVLGANIEVVARTKDCVTLETYANFLRA